MKKIIVGLVMICAALGALADNTEGCWVFTENGSTRTGTISDGTWTFKASYDKNTTNMTVSEVTEYPSEVTALDFSKPIEKLNDPNTTYTIVKLDALFCYNTGDFIYREGCDKVGELTLPGEGLTVINGYAFKKCENMTGDLVFPSTLTTVGMAFMETKITSVHFKPSTVNIAGGSKNSRGCFAACTCLTNVVFESGGTATLNGYTFGGCEALEYADLSGVSVLTVLAGGESNSKNWHFNKCSALKEMVFSSALNSYSTNLFNKSMTALETVRFIGEPPKCLLQPVFAYDKSENGLSKTQKVTTIIDREYVDDWADYTQDGINSSTSTWGEDYVEEGVDAPYRLLIYEIEDPTIMPPVIASVDSSVGDTWATVTVNGDYLNGGTIYLKLVDVDTLETIKDVELEEFGKSYTFAELAAEYSYLLYYWAENDNGYDGTEGDCYSIDIITYPTVELAARVVYTESTRTLDFHYDTVDRSNDDGVTIYEIGKDGKRTWGIPDGDDNWYNDGSMIDTNVTEVCSDNLRPRVEKVVFWPSFKNYRPKTCSKWFSRMTNLTYSWNKTKESWSLTNNGVIFEGLENLDTSEAETLDNMFYNCQPAGYPDLTHFRTSKVKNLSKMFGYKGWKEMDLSSFDTRNVTDMQSMFIGCNSVETIYVSDLWKTNKVTNAKDMFLNCRVLSGKPKSENGDGDFYAYKLDSDGKTYVADNYHSDNPLEYACYHDPVSGQKGFFTYKDAPYIPTVGGLLFIIR